MRRLASALVTIVLWVGYVALAYTVGAVFDADFDVAFGAASLVLATVLVALVPLAYPRDRRTWKHWAGWTALAIFVPIVPGVWLPWLAISRRHHDGLRPPPRADVSGGQSP